MLIDEKAMSVVNDAARSVAKGAAAVWSDGSRGFVAQNNKSSWSARQAAQRIAGATERVVTRGLLVKQDKCVNAKKVAAATLRMETKNKGGSL